MGCTQRVETGLAVRVVGSVGVLCALLGLGTVVGGPPLGAVGLLGPLSTVGHPGPPGRAGLQQLRLQRLRYRRCEPRPGGSTRLRVGSLGPVGVLRPFGRLGLPAGQRQHAGIGSAGARLGLVGVVGLLGRLRPVRPLGLHRWVCSVRPLGGLGLLGELRLLRPFGIVGFGERSCLGRG